MKTLKQTEKITLLWLVLIVVSFLYLSEKQSESMVFGSEPVIWEKQMFPVASFEQSADGMLFETKPRIGGLSIKSTFNYNKGKLFGTAWFGDGLLAIVADCDKF